MVIRFLWHDVIHWIAAMSYGKTIFSQLMRSWTFSFIIQWMSRNQISVLNYAKSCSAQRVMFVHINLFLQGISCQLPLPKAFLNFWFILFHSYKGHYIFCSIFLVQTQHPVLHLLNALDLITLLIFSQNFYRNVPWVVLYQTYIFCYNLLIWLVTMATNRQNLWKNIQKSTP